MAFWDKISSSGRVEDRRRAGPMLALGGGGVSIAGIALVLLFTYFSGGNLGDVIGQLGGLQTPAQQFTQNDFAGTDDYEQFASKVLGSANDMWTEIFASRGGTYAPPKLVLFRSATSSSCGLASSASGPHYCPLDKTIYLDETFFDELQQKFKARGGDVAQAYVIAHEAAHHAQNELGVLDRINKLQQQSPNLSNDLSVRQELQADCFAGLWAHSVKDLGVFEEGEISEALDAAAAIGDDRIQQTIEGRITPENWTHGSSDQRVRWFIRGYDTGDFSQCDTFNS